MTLLELNEISNLTENEKQLLTIGANSIVVFNNQYQIYFDEKNYHFNHKNNDNLNESFFFYDEEVFVRDIKNNVSYQNGVLSFIHWNGTEINSLVLFIHDVGKQYLNTDSMVIICQ